jgi:hypothetical protein
MKKRIEKQTEKTEDWNKDLLEFTLPPEAKDWVEPPKFTPPPELLNWEDISGKDKNIHK